MLDHTPLPWDLEQCGDGYSIVNREFDGDEWDIGEIYSRKNAEFVVRACGAHDDLLAALKDLREWHRSEYQSNHSIDAKADAAIAKAEGRK